MATIFVKLFGKSTLGLAYGLSAAETLLAPAMPSTTARAGGIFMPIINSLSIASGSKPSKTQPFSILSGNDSYLSTLSINHTHLCIRAFKSPSLKYLNPGSQLEEWNWTEIPIVYLKHCNDAMDSCMAMHH